MKKFFIRTTVIVIWIALIFCGLYWPKWKILKYDDNTINVFVWGDILEASVVADFEKETGIKLNLSYYSSNEELIVKLKATKGEGYDLIIPSDYAVNILIKEDLIKALDKSLFVHWDKVNKNLLGHYYDPDNTYSIPFEWELFGFGVDKDYFKLHPTPPSWGMIFDPNVVKYKIAMNNDPIEAVEFASFYLYGMVDNLTPVQTQEIKEVLFQQKPWVAAYVNFRGDYFLATKNVAVVVASTSYIWRSKRQFDFVGFVVPKEGSFITIESFCIPKPSQKEELVFKFINYLSSPKSVATHFDTFALFPSTLYAPEILHMDEEAAKIMLSTEEDFKNYHFIRNVLPEDETRDIWVEVKNGDLY
ncbi:MAG: spermidine/putrescine ABC transporter substrate-binding protein [Verrucomicrobia bacterium]|nr:spermidine/putrescine ABC transporter substrate-binding protein [Verrucomicrobiota bacterium]